MIVKFKRGWDHKGLTKYAVKKKGKDFAQMTDYFTNPKRADSERLGFVHMVNFEPGEANDPHEAAAVMAKTVKYAPALKRAAGVKSTGQKAKNPPVLHCMMSWDKTEKGKISETEMLTAAQSCLNAIGLGAGKGYQHVIFEHVDTEHPHLHIQINLVHPMTGKQINPWQYIRRADKWIYQYEKSRGQRVTPARHDKYEARERNKEYVANKRRGSKNRDDWQATKSTPSSRRAAEEAEIIRVAYAQRAKEILEFSKAQAESQRRKRESLALAYELQKKRIKERYAELIADFHRHRKYQEKRPLKPKGPERKGSEWRGLNRRLREEKAQFFRREIAPRGLAKGDWKAYFNGIADGNPRAQMITLNEKVARHAMEEAVRKRNREQPLVNAMNAELASLSDSYRVKAQELKVESAQSNLDTRARWRELADQRRKVWNKYKIRHEIGIVVTTEEKALLGLSKQFARFTSNDNQSSEIPLQKKVSRAVGPSPGWARGVLTNDQDPLREVLIEHKDARAKLHLPVRDLRPVRPPPDLSGVDERLHGAPSFGSAFDRAGAADFEVEGQRGGKAGRQLAPASSPRAEPGREDVDERLRQAPELRDAFGDVVGQEFTINETPVIEPAAAALRELEASSEIPKDKPWRVRSKVRAPRDRRNKEIEPE